MHDSDTIRPALEAAADLYVTSGRPASFAALAEATALSEEALHDAFGTVDEPLVRYYADLVARCAETAARVAGDRAEERVGAFCFILLDLFEERPEFVAATYHAYAAPWGSAFRDSLAQALSKTLEGADVPGINQSVLSAGPVQFVSVDLLVRLLDSWLQDQSEGKDRSTALLDKSIRLYAEVASNQVANRALDVGRYVLEAGYLPRIPFLSDWLTEEKHG